MSDGLASMIDQRTRVRLNAPIAGDLMPSPSPTATASIIPAAGGFKQ